MPTPPSPERRRRGASLWVRFQEGLARTLITAGGLGTIVTVCLMFGFLAWVVLPLFASARLDEREPVEVPAQRPAHFLVDEYQSACAFWFPDGRLRVQRIDGGERVSELVPFAGAEVRCWSFDERRERAAFGLADGTLVVAAVSFESDFPTDVPERLEALGPGQSAVWEESLVERTAQGDLRRLRLVFEELLRGGLEGGRAPAALDFVPRGDGARLLVASEDAGLWLVDFVERLDFMTGETVRELQAAAVPLVHGRVPPGRVPLRMVLLEDGRDALAFWESGVVARLDLSDAEEPHLDSVDFVAPPEGGRLTAVAPALGRSTVLVGDSNGDARAWFLARGEESGSPESLIDAHHLPGVGSPVEHIAASSRSRLAALSIADGSLRLWHVTTDSEVARGALERPGPVLALALAPKEDGLFALTPGGVARWELDPAFPEATLASLFLPVWYEGYPAPAHAWQSSGGTDEFEPKLGLWPLVYGTLKATFYSMLFGVPLALLAALFTSEILTRRLRAPVKSTIEMMASLPSVVLGFLAALFIAPLVQEVVPETIVALFLVPTCLLLGAHLWQLLPEDLVLRLGTGGRLAAIAAMLPLGIAIAFGWGPLPNLGRWIEARLFAGDLFLWLDGQAGTGTGGWFFLVLPLAGLAAALLSGRFVTPRLRGVSGLASRPVAGALALASFALVLGLAIGLALALAAVLQQMGWDPRGSLVGTYVQRNALIVGFVMGFAIVPIIYTLSEDALSSVPEHLRFASLGAGATPWQTAVRIVAPTAASGLFSAIMIGLGRAVGETMIVLMATGNTAVMEWNMFNGFRTLSANIAVELPEAVKDSTHYRTLFLAAFVLFLLTFSLNTLAEVVRQRFRRRATQL